MNNKKIGTAFEREVVDFIARSGGWVHFLTPDERGAQPFDIIAVKNDVAIAVECKTLSTDKRYFSIDRLEENQRMAFERWLACGNSTPVIFIEYGDSVRVVTYSELKRKGKIDMRIDANSCDNAQEAWQRATGGMAS